MPQLHVNFEYVTNYGLKVKIVELDKTHAPFVYLADNGDRYTPHGRCNLIDEDYDIDKEYVPEPNIRKKVIDIVDDIEDEAFLQIVFNLIEHYKEQE